MSSLVLVDGNDIHASQSGYLDCTLLILLCSPYSPSFHISCLIAIEIDLHRGNGWFVLWNTVEALLSIS